VGAVADQRGYTAGRFVIELGGAAAGFARSVQGGQARAEVVKEAIGPDQVVHKHIGNVKYDDLVLQVGPSMSDSFFDWIASTFDTKHETRDGAVSFQDYSGFEKQRLSWTKGLITGIGFPTLDASSKDPAYLMVTIKPESTTNAKGSGAKVTSTAQGMKAWLPSNFGLTINGIDCSKVKKVEGLTITRQPGERGVGETRDAAAEPGVLEIANRVVTVAEALAADFVAWHEDFVVKGNFDKAHVKEGKLECLASNMKDVLFTLQMRGLGIFGFSPVQETSGNAAVASVEAELYCEEMSFEYGKKPAVAPPPPSSSSGGAAPPADASVLDPASVLASAIRTLLDKPVLQSVAPETTAARLLATTNDPLAKTTDSSSDGERGRLLGVQWARERATLEELEQVAAARGGDWTNLVLDADNSLVAYLQTVGAVPESHEGPLALERDPFVEGVVVGAAEVFDEVRPHLERRPE
jgi:hypothetical protein